MKKNFISLIATTSVFALSSAATAQTIDYGSLEMLFDEPVTTSATGKPQRASDAPVTMEIITAEEIRRSGATDIPEVLRAYSGMSVQRSTMGGVDVGMRGYNAAFNERILVMINGRQVYLDHFGYVEWASLPVSLEEIRQIEVVKGPNTALYGFNAVSGVINIITYNPLYDSNAQVTVRGGGHDYREVNATYTGKLTDKIGVRLSGGLWRSTDFTTHLHHMQENALRDDSTRNFLSAEVIGQLTDNIQAGFEFTHSDSEQGELFFDSTFSYSDYKTFSYKGFLAAETKAGLTEFNVYQNSADLVNTSTLAGNAAFIAIPVDTKVTVFELDHLFKVGADHTFRGSVSYRKNTNPTFPVALGELNFKIWSLGGMWDWTVNDKLSFIAATRYDMLKMSRTGEFFPNLPFDNEAFDRKINEWSLNGGLVYKATDKDTVRLTVGRGIDLPSATEFSLLKEVEEEVFQVGNPNLKTSIVWNVEAGYDRDIEAINGTFRAAAFYYKAANLQNIQQNEGEELTNGVHIFLAENALDSRTYGFEAAIKGEFSETLDWYINYLYVDVQDTQLESDHDAAEEAPADGDTGHGGGGGGIEAREAIDFENNAPKHTINFGVGYHKDRFSLDLKGSYTSSRNQLRGNRRIGVDEHGDEFEVIELLFIPIKSSLQVNARAAYNITDQLTLAVEGIGITKKEYTQTSLAKIERRVNVSLNYRF